MGGGVAEEAGQGGRDCEIDLLQFQGGRVYAGMTAGVKVYGADWCEDTQRVLGHLDDLGVKYEYLNLDDDEKAAAWVRHQNDGKEKKPTLDIGGIVMVNPSDTELDIALKENSLVCGGYSKQE